LETAIRVEDRQECRELAASFIEFALDPIGIPVKRVCQRW
jgi:hypothetical protein